MESKAQTFGPLQLFETKETLDDDSEFGDFCLESLFEEFTDLPDSELDSLELDSFIGCVSLPQPDDNSLSQSDDNLLSQSDDNLLSQADDNLLDFGIENECEWECIIMVMLLFILCYLIGLIGILLVLAAKAWNGPRP